MSTTYAPSSSDARTARTSTPPYCSAKWRDALLVCRKNLSEPDLAQLVRIETCDDFLSTISELQASVTQKQDTAPTLAERLAPSLDPLRSFVTLLAASLSSNTIKTAFIWGIMTLLIQAASRTEKLLPETIEMLKDLSHDLEMLQIYETTFADNTQMGNELMDIFVDIITFWTQAIRFLQRNKHGSTTMEAWPNVCKKFEETSRRIRKRSQQIKERANALTVTQPQRQADLLKELSRMGLLSPSTPQQPVPFGSLQAAPQTSKAPDMDATIAPVPIVPALGPDDLVFPCDNIPFARNTYFFGRQAELTQIREQLDNQSALGSFKSFALYGTGGIGKTQTALAYAYEQVDARADAVLWFNCETNLSIARSFFDVAKMLQLEGITADETSDQNKVLVLSWLRGTIRKWVMIMDNVEDPELLRTAWPVAAHGKVLVTSRNDVVSFDPAAGGLEIEVFDEHDGCKFVLSLVGRKNYSNEEQEAARNLSIRLGGLALAIAVMAAQIRLRSKSIADFLGLYRKHPQRLNRERRGVESRYNFSLQTCWQTAFESLSEEASTLLGIIAHIGPDAIPEALFHPNQSARLPQDLEFCKDEWALDEALKELLKTSLIRKDPATRMLFVHRLIQLEYRSFIDKEQQHQSFVLASELLCEQFPKLHIGQSLRNHWDKCKLYIQHVLMLCARYQDCRFRPKVAGEFNQFLELSKPCGWYLMECGDWKAELQLMETALEICEDKNGATYAVLANSLGLTETERAHCNLAHQYMDKSLESFTQILGPNHEEVANGYNNYGNVILQDLKPGACEKAIDYYNKCVAIFETKSYEVQSKIMHIPHTNISRALRVLGRYEDSIAHAETSRRWAIGFFGSGKHFDGLADYQVGNALYDMGKHVEAEKHWQRALEIFTKENEMHPTTNAAKLKLSQIAMKRGGYDEAIATLEKILIVAQLNEPSKGDKGETARIMRKLAEAHELKGDVAEAMRLKASAEAMRKEIQGDRFESLPDEDLSYAMMNFHAFW